MSFILEIIPVSNQGNTFAYVVRSGNGAPIRSCSSLDEAKSLIQEYISKTLDSKVGKS